MGQQSNKVIKRRRRIAYLERKKIASKAVAKPKPKARAPKKAAAASAPSNAAPAA